MRGIYTLHLSFLCYNKNMNEVALSPLTLRHPDVYYQTDEWYDLGARTRKNLMLVAEGLRPAAFVEFEENRTALFNVLDKLELYNDYEGLRDCFVSRAREDMRTYTSPFFRSAPRLIRTRMLGKLLGYPNCCIVDYYKRRKYKRGSHLSRILTQKIRPVRIPDEFAFIEHYPCSIECKPTLEEGRRNQAFMKMADPFTHDMTIVHGTVRWGNTVNQGAIHKLVEKYGRTLVLEDAQALIRKPTDQVLRENYQI